MAADKKIDNEFSDFMHVSHLTSTWKDLYSVEFTLPSTTEIEAENGKRMDSLRLSPVLKAQGLDQNEPKEYPLFCNIQKQR